MSWRFWLATPHLCRVSSFHLRQLTQGSLSVRAGMALCVYGTCMPMPAKVVRLSPSSARPA